MFDVLTPVMGRTPLGTYYYFLATMGDGRFGWKTFVDYGLYSDVLTAEAFYYGSLHCLSPDFEGSYSQRPQVAGLFLLNLWPLDLHVAAFQAKARISMFQLTSEKNYY